MPKAVLSWVPVRTGMVRFGSQAIRFANTCFVTIPVASAQSVASGTVSTSCSLVCRVPVAPEGAVGNVVAEGQER